MQKQYDPATLKRLQKAELSILKEFDQVCRKHKIAYFLYAGSLLGAIRHKGFIPWDDDLDIGMERKEYNKFRKIVSEELGEKYVLATPITHPGYCGTVIKLMRKDTKFVPDFSIEMKCDLGIHIDIFVWDHLKDGRIESWIQIKKARILSQLIFLCGSSKPNIGYNLLVKFILGKMCELIHFILVHIPKITEILYKYFERISQQENYKSTKSITSFQSNNPMKAAYRKEAFYPYLQMDFEDLTTFVPDNYDVILKNFYGDYMKLPEKEKRINHCADIIDFGNIY